MKNGGLNCGWHPADHKDFLRIRTKHNNKTNTVAFMTELMRAVPDLDEDKIREHVQSYDLYLTLNDQKKELLAKYKEAKKSDQKGKVDQQAVFNKINGDLQLILGDGKENSKNVGNTGEDKQKMKEDLLKWKQEKEERKRKEIDDKKKQEEEQRMRMLAKMDEERRQKKE